MKCSYRVVIGDNSFPLIIDVQLFETIKSSLSHVKDIKLIEQNDFECENIKLNAELIYESMKHNSLENKIKFVSEILGLIAKEKLNDQENI